MIKSFGDKVTEQLFQGLAVRRMDQGLQKQALRRLRYIDAAVTLETCGYRLPIDWRPCKVI
jgi:plasmid maintenance system killer protein